MSTNYSTGVIAYGSTISFANISSGTIGSYTKVAQSVDVDSPTPETGKINITNNDSPNNTKEYVPGMVDPGEVEFDLVFFPTAHIPVLNMNGDGVIRSWKEAFPDGTTAVFPAFVSSAGVTGKTEDEVLKGKIKLTLTSNVVWTAGTGPTV